jgi:hypothetical protein
MTTISQKVSLVCFCIGVLAVSAGCKKSGPGASDGTNIHAAFQGTKPELKEFAEQAAAAEKRNDFGTAFVQYRALSMNPDLTPEQRNLVSDSMQAMNKKLREAATNGDMAAQSMLKMYQATK